MTAARNSHNPLDRELRRYYPDGIPGLTSCRIAGSGTMVAAGREIGYSFTEVIEFGKRFRWELESRDLRALDCYDGDFGHQRMGDGRLQTFEGREAASFRMRLIMESAAFLIPLTKPGVKVEVVKANTIEAAFDTGDRIWMSFDPETHYPCEVRGRRYNSGAGKEMLMKVRLADWMRAARIVLPTTSRASWEDTEFLVQKVTSFVPNPDTSRVVFDPTALREFRVPR